VTGAVPGVTVARADPSATRELRRRVLRPGFAPDDALPGDDVPDAVHFAARDSGGTVVGACFVQPEPCSWRPDGADAWRLRSMATAPELQGRGVGGAVLDAAMEFLAGRQVPLLWCHARATAVGFYERHGFAGWGEIFVDEATRLPHLHMAVELPARPVSS
jgi:GNAT superfamily N-acetyltransferase